MKLAVASDHAGFDLKQTVYQYLIDQGHDVADLGTNDKSSCNYPDIAKKMAETLQQSRADLGILICGTGIGMSMTANKFKGIRAACCSDIFSAKYTRAHNDANVLCFGERVVGAGLAQMLVDAFISTEYEGGRHQIRLDIIEQIEKENFK